ncbi:MAG: hypothetical protein V4733_12180 [Verrucomicrobiota bacterium]
MIAEPGKELRFTRSGQAPVFWILAAMGVSAALTILAAACYRWINPSLPHPLWAVLPGIPAFIFARLAVRMTRKAYLILTPLGIEIFPFFRPAANMQLVSWAEIVAADFDSARMTLHFSAEKTAGIHVSLAPVRADRRPLLEKAVKGRVNNDLSGKSLLPGNSGGHSPGHASALTADSQR